MSGALADLVLQLIREAEGNYYRLVVIAAPSGRGKTSVLNEVACRLGVEVINLNQVLAASMLELTERQRILQLPKLLEEVVEAQSGKLCLLDNIEMLFSPALQHDPLKLLLGLARNRTITVTWNGAASNDHLVYAEPGHPEYQRYPVKDFLLATPES